MRLELRSDPTRATLGLMTLASARKVVTLTALLGPLVALLYSSAVPEPGPLPAVLAAVTALVVPLIAHLLIWMRLRADAAGVRPGDHWILRAEGVVVTRSDRMTFLPWTSIVSFRLSDDSTAFMTRFPYHVLRTEVPLHPASRPVVERWWRATRSVGRVIPPPMTGSLPAVGTPAPPSAADAPSPPAPGAVAGSPSTAPVIEIRAALTAREWGSIAPSPRNRRRRLRFFALVAAAPALRLIDAANGNVTTSELVWILVFLAFQAFFAVTLVRPLRQRLGLTTFAGWGAKAYAERLWGPGPLTWTFDPVGIEQAGTNGLRLERPWSPTTTVEAEGPVLRVSRPDGGDIVVPLRAFAGDQLDRVLAWSTAWSRPAVPDTTDQQD